LALVERSFYGYFFVSVALKHEGRPIVKEGIHPTYFETTITCACGNVIDTGSTAKDVHVEICSAGHPFYSGKQKLMDTEGRVDKFLSKYGLKK
jgi:large subunit ribosomal protein L31